jgi:hypothetical protein
MKHDLIALAVVQGWLIEPQRARQDIEEPRRREQGRSAPQILVGPGPS